MKMITTKAVQIVAPPRPWLLGFARLDKFVNHNYNSSIMNYGFKKFFAFTLAEVLITLGIIGVVAALTIPTLVSNYKQRAWDTAANVFERKLEESLKTMNTQQTLAGYSNTSDFVNELSKHFKITRVCKNDDLLNCFEDKIYWNTLDISAGKEIADELDLSSFSNAHDLGQNDWNTEIIGVQFANGTTGLVAYNPDCKQNPYSNQVTGTSCLAMLYDTDGFKTPNTSGKDLRSINANIGCNFKSGGNCFTTPFYPEPITIAECEQLKSDLGISECYYESDYWAGAVKKCKTEGKRLPSQSELAQIASYMYNTDVSSSQDTFATRDNNKVSQLGFKVTSSTGFSVWSSEEYSSIGTAEFRYFYSSNTGRNDGYRDISSRQAVCLGD